jgi:hypothetical protein
MRLWMQVLKIGGSADLTGSSGSLTRSVDWRALNLRPQLIATVA